MRTTALRRLGTYGVASALALGVFVGTMQTTAQSPEVGVPEFSGKDPTESPILAPCSRFADNYDDLGYTDTHIEEWPDLYHDTVAKIVTESLDSPKISCTADDYEALLKAGDELKKLAKKLPPWKDTDTEVSRFDLPRVLLENLRIYECALVEFRQFLHYDTAAENFDEEKERQEKEEGRSPDDTTVISFFKFFFSDLMTETSKRAETIKRERAIARRALNRTLTLIGTMDRLRPLEAELECMQRMSLDVRNIAALSAETSSCIPRTWNAKDTLRDYKEDPSEQP